MFDICKHVLVLSKTLKIPVGCVPVGADVNVPGSETCTLLYVKLKGNQFRCYRLTKNNKYNLLHHFDKVVNKIAFATKTTKEDGH